jgi:hypothetical protein
VQARTLRWLDGHRFADRTGVAPDQVRFCRVRAEKRRHCEELELTHFVDDRTDVHEAIRATVQYQYFFGHQTAPSYGYAAPDWPSARHLIRASLDQSSQDTWVER